MVEKKRIKIRIDIVCQNLKFKLALVKIVIILKFSLSKQERYCNETKKKKKKLRYFKIFSYNISKKDIPSMLHFP